MFHKTISEILGTAIILPEIVCSGNKINIMQIGLFQFCKDKYNMLTKGAFMC